MFSIHKGNFIKTQHNKQRFEAREVPDFQELLNRLEKFNEHKLIPSLTAPMTLEKIIHRVYHKSHVQLAIFRGV